MKLHPIARIFLFAALAALMTAPLVSVASTSSEPVFDGCAAENY